MAGGSMMVQREKLGCHEVPKDSDNPMGSSESAMTFQSCPKSGQWIQALVPYKDQSLDTNGKGCGLVQGRSL